MREVLLDNCFEHSRLESEVLLGRLGVSIHGRVIHSPESRIVLGEANYYPEGLLHAGHLKESMREIDEASRIDEHIRLILKVQSLTPSQHDTKELS